MNTEVIERQLVAGRRRHPGRATHLKVSVTRIPPYPHSSRASCLWLSPYLFGFRLRYGNTTGTGKDGGKKVCRVVSGLFLWTPGGLYFVDRDSSLCRSAIVFCFFLLIRIPSFPAIPAHQPSHCQKAQMGAATGSAAVHHAVAAPFLTSSISGAGPGARKGLSNLGSHELTWSPRIYFWTESTVRPRYEPAELVNSIGRRIRRRVTA